MISPKELLERVLDKWYIEVEHGGLLPTCHHEENI
jgi:hypothetical protein